MEPANRIDRPYVQLLDFISVTPTEPIPSVGLGEALLWALHQVKADLESFYARLNGRGAAPSRDLEVLASLIQSPNPAANT